MIDSSGKCAVGSPASDSEQHDKEKEKETERDKDNKDTAHGVGCLSAADNGHAATVAAVTQSPNHGKTSASLYDPDDDQAYAGVSTYAADSFTESQAYPTW